MNLGVAIALAAEVFKDKTDKGGKPYILHCLWVMDQMETDDEKIVAVLHDVVEDTIDSERPITGSILLSMGFSHDIVRDILILSHTDGSDYLEVYIPRVAMFPRTKKVKRADLMHNSNITRLKGLRQKDFDRLRKYLTAFVYLSN